MLEGWTRSQLGNLGTFHKGKGITKSELCDDGVPCLRYAEIYTTFGDVTSKLISFVPTESASDATSIKYGDIIFAASGETAEDIGKAVAFVGRFDAVAGGDTVILRDHGQDPSFLAHLLNSHSVIKQKSRLGKGQSIVHIHASDLAGVTVDLPPLPEQRKIAEILRTWDEAIEKLEALRAAKREQLIGLAQKLLGIGGVFPERWEQRPLSAISTRVRRQNGGGDHPVMTISAKSGFRLQSDKFSRDMAGSSVDRYIVLNEGEFAYNKGNSLTAPYGCIFPLDRPTALVPFVYFCFALNAGMNREFYAHLFAAGALNHQLSRLINSGVRNDGLLNLDPEDFFGCKVPVPPVEEQASIAQALTASKQEVGLLDREIDLLTRQKRGLMQKLLTGEWRVQVEEAA
ncbi:restriction endonuclease subunit S [Altererythrobacter lauratis]|uniref:Restriction endonuclease subunit S n=1 Tax=Alteraurantiacibacter lauratis TaxID=2054627 RepID=A0ABV7EDX5_9SPHN